MISGKSKRRQVFVEADNIASDFMLLSGKVPDFLKEAGLELGLIEEKRFDEIVKPEKMIGR